MKIEKEIGGLSVITEIVQHNRSSTLRARIGKEHAKDMIGETAKELLEENVAKFDPFNRSREMKHTFIDRPKDIYCGLTEVQLEKFIASKKREFNLKYQ